MAKRRKVSNLMALAILSTLVQRPMHPYEIASMLRSHGKEQDMKIKWGSLYTVVQNLEKHEFIAQVESSREGARPERTIYRITDAGKEELEDWVRELVSTPEPELPRFKAALSVVAVLHPDELIRLLGQRLAQIDEELAAEREAHAKYNDEIPRLFLIEVEYDLAIRQAEADWIRALLGELADGTFPGLDAWRDWHEKGELPPELVELAERHS
ncbi:PadR family transcriptional regulator [Flindersiella endophytica]